MFLLGLLSLLQIIFLPGWLWLRLADVRTRNVYESAVYAFGASLILNHLLVCLLTLTHLHNRWLWLAIIFIEIAALTWLRRKSSAVEASSWSDFQDADGSYRSLLIPALAAASLLSVGALLWANWGTVFISNDDVASWDRWAEDWYLNRSPVGSHLYPQLIPANWSISYALMGRPEVKMFAKAIMPLFPLAILTLFVSLASIRRDRAFLAGCAVCGFLFLEYLGRDFLITGYVDSALAFYCFLAFYAIYSSDRNQDEAQSRLIAVFFAAGAALTKQGGLVALGAILVYALWARQKGDEKSRAAIVLRLSAWVSPELVVAWYVWKNYSDPSWKLAMQNILGDVHQGRDYFERFVHACGLFISAGDRLGPALFAMIVMMVALGLVLGRTRNVTAGIILPFFLIWAFGFSYEIRTASPLLPFLALVIGIVLVGAENQLFARWALGGGVFRNPLPVGILLASVGFALVEWGGELQKIQLSYGWPLVLVGLAFVASPIIQPRFGLVKRVVPALAIGVVAGIALVDWPVFSDDRLIADQLAAERRMGRPEVNDRLYRLRADGRLNQPVLTNYWFLSALPGLKSLNRNLNCGDCAIDSLLSEIKRGGDVGFLLLDDSAIPSQTTRLIEHCDGLSPIFADRSIRLVQIDQARLGKTCVVDPEAIRPTIEKLYPAETLAGKGFNIQPNGSAAIAIACRNASAQSVILWAGRELPSSYGGENALSAEVPVENFAKRGSYSLEIWDKGTRLKSRPVTFEVK